MPKNPFAKSKPEEAKTEIHAPKPEVAAVPKGPLDCPECGKSINHAGPHA